MKAKSETVKLSDGSEVEVIVPSPSLGADAQLYYLSRWRYYAEEKKIMTNKEMNEFVTERGLVTPERNEKIEKLTKEIMDIKRKLKAGKKGYKTLDEASKAAFSVRDKQAEMISLMSEANEFFLKTAESLAEVDRFNYMVAKCVYKDGELYFDSLEDYLDRQDEQDSLVVAAKLATLISPYVEENGLETDEDKFLYKYGFINEKGSRIDKQGRLIDESGRLINENRRYIDEDGNFVDINGNRVDEDGNPVVEFEDFTDESGEVIQPKELPA